MSFPSARPGLLMTYGLFALLLGAATVAFAVSDCSTTAQAAWPYCDAFGADDSQPALPAKRPAKGNFPLLGQGGPVPAEAALHQTSTTSRSADLRQSCLAAVRVWKLAPPDSLVAPWLQNSDGSRPIYWRLSLQILLCTWQA